MQQSNSSLNQTDQHGVSHQEENSREQLVIEEQLNPQTLTISHNQNQDDRMGSKDLESSPENNIHQYLQADPMGMSQSQTNDARAASMHAPPPVYAVDEDQNSLARPQ